MVTGGSEQRQIRTPLKFPQRRITLSNPNTDLPGKIMDPQLLAARDHEATSISTNTLFLLQNGSRASQYFRFSAFCASGHCSTGSTRAVAANSGPVILP